ncbi:hypothetical protein KQI63_16490 [bacterium]|nr:hypothetical protein [bacterium]
MKVFLRAGWLVLLIGLLGGLGSALASDLATTVKYVSASGIYLDAGSDQGIAVGDRVQIEREGSTVATLEVTYLAGTTAVCKLVEGGPVQVGDRATVAASGEVMPEEAEVTEEDSVAVTPSTGTKRQVVRTVEQERPRARLSGRLGVQVMIQDDLEATNYDVTEPSLTGRLRAENLFNSYYTLNLRFRSRRVQRASDLSPDTQSEWFNRVYEVSFGYDNPSSPLHYNAGRILSNRFAGIGTIDGLHFEMQQQERFSYGLFAGTQPDYRTSRPGTDETKGGVYAAIERGSWETTRLAATLAFAGRYNSGTISQEYLYEQLQLSGGRTWSLYQSGELEVYRGWRKDVEGQSFGMSNLLLTGRWRPVDDLSLDIGYDNRTQVRTYETRDTPDSLFDDALRQGYRAGASYIFPFGMRLFTRAGLRLREGDSQDTRTLLGGISQRDLLGSGVKITAQINTFENRYSTGMQPSLQLTRYLFRTVYLNGQVGQSRYDLSAGGKVTYSFAKLGASMTLARSWYTSVYGEAYRGDNLASNRVYLEVGYRL